MQRLRTILCAMLLSLPAIAFAVEPVDINTADAQVLRRADAIKGVGLSRATANRDLSRQTRSVRVNRRPDTGARHRRQNNR